jgi:DNA/RNA-binding domain of Phe-tRNA-synthetase-like protein
MVGLISPWPWALGASAIAALLVWDEVGDWKREAALRAELRTSAARERVLAERVLREAEAAQEWRQLYADIEAQPDTNSCGSSVDRALDIVRQKRATNP